MNIINVENITKVYTERELFSKASFYVQEREKIGIVGINGTGKSTLLKIVAGLETPDEGKVTIAKCDVEECEDIAVDLGIRSVPTIMFFKEGKLVDKIVGAANKAKIQEKIESML